MAVVGAKIAGKDISSKHEFKVGDTTVVTLPTPPSEDNSGNDNNGDNSDEDVYVPPIASETAIVGRSFVILFTVDYVAPVKTLIMVSRASSKHWLYFSKLQ